MTERAGRWWEYAERSLPHPTWQATKEAFLHKYGNILKREECTKKLKKLYQGSMTIADFFTEAEDLNLYARLDPETLPTFLKPELNTELRDTMEVAHALQPITTYQNWREKALHLGTRLEAGKKKPNAFKSDEGPHEKSHIRIECVKCGKKRHIGRDCRTGWKYEVSTATTTAELAITTIEKKKPEKQQPKRKLVDQPDGSITTIVS